MPFEEIPSSVSTLRSPSNLFLGCISADSINRFNWSESFLAFRAGFGETSVRWHNSVQLTRTQVVQRIRLTSREACPAWGQGVFLKSSPWVGAIS